jgi:protein-S-isoprenylcysteine O-methyltransferase Ste14
LARLSFTLFAAAAYAIFFATFLYLIGFLADLPFLPHTINRAEADWGMTALAIDIALIAAFGIQHSVMARRGFKRAWTRIVPEPIERSVYVLAASLMLILLFLYWKPLPIPIWTVTNPVGAAALWVLFGLGWAIVLLSTFLINHFELFGLKQAWTRRGDAVAAPVLRQPFLYRLVRHPLYSGFFLAFWATPMMTLGHLVLSLGMSIYMLIGIRYEERDLVESFGGDYAAYRERVGMLLPRFRRG